jgi:proline dehydrogenase
MATQIERAKATLDALLNKDVSNEQILRIVTSFSKHFENDFTDSIDDPENPTNSELAGFFVKKIREYGKKIVIAQARAETIQLQRDSIITAENTAAADLNE